MFGACGPLQIAFIQAPVAVLIRHSCPVIYPYSGGLCHCIVCRNSGHRSCHAFFIDLATSRAIQQYCSN